MRRVHARTKISVPSLIVAVADTHGKPHRELDRRLEEAKPDHILHAGDVGDLSVIDALEKHAPVTAVRGNIDGRAHLPDVITIDLVHGSTIVQRILLTHIAVNGPKLSSDITRLALKEDASIVVCGHSHVPFLTRTKEGIVVFNPGSVGPRRFQLPILFGILDVKTDGVSIAHVDCETGKPWAPNRTTPRPPGEPARSD